MLSEAGSRPHRILMTAAVPRMLAHCSCASQYCTVQLQCACHLLTSRAEVLRLSSHRIASHRSSSFTHSTAQHNTSLVPRRAVPFASSRSFCVQSISIQYSRSIVLTLVVVRDVVECASMRARELHCNSKKKQHPKMYSPRHVMRCTVCTVFTVQVHRAQHHI